MREFSKKSVWRLPLEGIFLHKVASLASGVILLLTAPASAQPIPNTPSAQAVGLFIQTCIPFAGDVLGLRKWISDHHLPQLSGEFAAAFLRNLGSGQVFSASNDSGKYMLVSYDNGTCGVIGEQGDMRAAEDALLSYLSSHGFAVTPAASRHSPIASQKIYRVKENVRHWTLSITLHEHPDAPNLQPELDLLATP